MKTEIINARVEPALKASAEKIFRALGMKTTDAISIFLTHVVSHRGLPFDVRLPNKETRKAIMEAHAGKNMTEHASLEDMRRTIEGKPAKNNKKL